MNYPPNQFLLDEDTRRLMGYPMAKAPTAGEAAEGAEDGESSDSSSEGGAGVSGAEHSGVENDTDTTSQVPEAASGDPLYPPREPFQRTTRAAGSAAKEASPHKMLGLDCEMCRTKRGLELARFTLVDEKLGVVCDELVLQCSHTPVK